jgi:hypothetical protein
MVPATGHDWRGRLITSRPRYDRQESAGVEFFDENRGSQLEFIIAPGGRLSKRGNSVSLKDDWAKLPAYL